MTLLDALKAPMLASPDSLAGQLAYMRDNWVEYLGEKFAEALNRTLTAVGVLQEEEIAIWTMFHPIEGGKHRHGEPKWGSAGFEGDEFIGLRGHGTGRSAAAERIRGIQPRPGMDADRGDDREEHLRLAGTAFEKNTSGISIGLDQIPGEEFGVLADRGINALWLIGLWERSTASQTIKRMMGQHDAVASAYSLKDYRIADDLGGTHAYEHLRNTAWRYGIRLGVRHGPEPHGGSTRTGL